MIGMNVLRYFCALAFEMLALPLTSLYPSRNASATAAIPLSLSESLLVSR